MKEKNQWGTARIQIYDYILRRGRATSNDIGDETDVSRNTASHVLRQMAEDGILNREKATKVGPKSASLIYEYWIPDEVQERWPTTAEYKKHIMGRHLERMLGGIENLDVG